MENSLPYDIVAEDAVLGSVIANPGEYETVGMGQSGSIMISLCINKNLCFMF